MTQKTIQVVTDDTVQAQGTFDQSDLSDAISVLSEMYAFDGDTELVIGGIVEPDETERERTVIEKAEEIRSKISDGDILEDPESNPKFGDGRVLVKEILAIRADEYDLPDVPNTPTVAEMNPSHPENDPVILASYVEGSDKMYAFPASRLEYPGNAGRVL